MGVKAVAFHRTSFRVATVFVWSGGSRVNRHWCECPCCGCSPQSLSAPTLSSSCLGTASRSRWSYSRCTGCSAGKSTSWSTVSSREHDALMCARQSWVPFAFWPSTCIMQSSLTGMTFFSLSTLSALSAECLNSINTSIFFTACE